MKRLPIVILMVVAASFLAFNSMGKSTRSLPPGNYEKIMKLVGEMLSQGHYSPHLSLTWTPIKIFSCRAILMR